MTQLAKLTAVILCGGLGTRLREETEFKPKPMVEIGGRPIVWHIMKHYRHYGVRNFILCLGYKGDVIRNYFLNYPLYNSDFVVELGGDVRTLTNGYNEDWRVTLAETGRDSQTGSRIKKILRYLDTDTFLATYGDGLSDVDLDRLYAHHRASGRLGTVTAVRPSSRFGELAIDGGLVKRFREKPQVTEGWINGGFFVLEPEVLEYIAGDETHWEHEPLEQLAGEGQLMAYRHDDFWQCVDTVRDLRLLEALWASGKAPWKVWD